MKLKITIFLSAAILSFSACSQPEAGAPLNSANQPVQRPMSNAANANGSQGMPANQPLPANAANIPLANTVPPPPAPGTDTPTAAFKALVEAGGKKDSAALNQLFNRKSLEMFSGEAKAQGKTLEQVLLNQRTITLVKGAPEIRNEKIEGDTATIEVRSAATGNWDRVYFVREDGRWKIAMDLYMEAKIKEIEEKTKSLESAGEERDK